MTFISIQDGEKTLQLKSIKLINQNTNKYIDLIKMYVEIDITESLENKFMMGSIIINSEYDIREFLSMDGTERIKIAWTTGDDYADREHVFRLLSIPSQDELQENVLETITINFVDERYLTLISNDVYEIFTENTVSDILTTMFTKLNITSDIEATTETLSYYWMNTFINCLNQIRISNSDPIMVFQQNNAIVGRTLSTLFNQNPIELEYTNVNTPIKENQISNRIIKDISSINVFDTEDLYDNGLGNKLLSRDYWNKTFTYEDKKLSDASLLNNAKLKFKVDGDVRERVDFPNYQYIEDYVLTDFVEAVIPYGMSNLFVGMLVTIDIPSKYDPNDTSLRSGNYLIHTINHKIDRNLAYIQNVTLIRKELFKNNI